MSQLKPLAIAQREQFTHGIPVARGARRRRTLPLREQRRSQLARAESVWSVNVERSVQERRLVLAAPATGLIDGLPDLFLRRLIKFGGQEHQVHEPRIRLIFVRVVLDRVGQLVPG